MTFSAFRNVLMNTRLGRYLSSAGLSFIGRIVGLLSAVISVPISLRFYGQEQFGLWMTISGIVGFMTFADLGISAGLQNELSKCFGLSDRTRPASLIANGLFILSLAFLLVVGIALFALPYIPFESWLKLKSTNQNQPIVLWTLQAAMISFAFGFIGGVFNATVTAYHRGFVASASAIVGKSLSLIWIIICGWTEQELPVLVAGFIGIPNLLNVCGLVILFFRIKWLQPSFSSVNLKTIKQMQSFGGYMLISQLSYLLFFSGPPILIASKFGASVVAEYTLVQRLFGMASMPFSIIICSLWPMYTHSLAQKDYTWIIRTFKRSILGVGVGSLIIYTTVWILKFKIIAIWSGLPLLSMSIFAIAWIALWEYLKCNTEVFSIFLIGVNRVRLLSIIGIVLATVCYSVNLLASTLEQLLFAYASIGGGAMLICLAIEAFLVSRDFRCDSGHSRI